MVALGDVPVRPVGTPDGDSWLLRGVPRFDAEGQFEGYVGTARPGHAPAAASAPQLTLDAAESSELLSEQAAFSYTVTHDLRAPIRVVEGFARILKEDYGRVLDRIGNDHLDRVLAAAARMNSMIDALLTLANLSAQPLARQPVNLSQLAGFVVDDLKRATAERKVEVEIAPGMVVDGDPTLLRLVLENLLGNAWKYTGKCQAPEVWLERRAQHPDTFSVRDNGAGFDMRFADRLFGVFQRLHSASDFQGTGIGLASVRRIIRRHGGEVWAEAEVDRGASFHFRLPSR
jgi:light-regulated signal transduction histidine kinase (bacteriophytochrome)